MGGRSVTLVLLIAALAFVAGWLLNEGTRG
jgi:hypothetical protein